MINSAASLPWIRIAALVVAVALCVYAAVAGDSIAAMAAAGIGLSVKAYGWGREDGVNAAVWREYDRRFKRIMEGR